MSDEFYDLFRGAFPVNQSEILKGILVDDVTFSALKETSRASHNDSVGTYPLSNMFGGVPVCHYENFPKGVYFTHYLDGSIIFHLSVSMKFLDFKSYLQDMHDPTLYSKSMYSIKKQNDAMILRNQDWVVFGNDRDYCVSLTLTGICPISMLEDLKIPHIKTYSEFKETILDTDYFGKAELCHQVAEKWYQEHLQANDQNSE